MSRCLVCKNPKKPYRADLMESGIDYCDCKDKYEKGAEHELSSFTDLLGNKVEVGDVIATALIAGRSANMAIFEVNRIYLKRGYSGWERRLRVLPMGRTYGRTEADMNAPVEDRKPSTLQFFDRSVLLEKRV